MFPSFLSFLSFPSLACCTIIPTTWWLITHVSSEGLLIEVFWGFLSRKVTSRRSVHSPRHIYRYPTDVTDVTFRASGLWLQTLPWSYFSSSSSTALHASNSYTSANSTSKTTEITRIGALLPGSQSIESCTHPIETLLLNKGNSYVVAQWIDE